MPKRPHHTLFLLICATALLLGLHSCQKVGSEPGYSADEEALLEELDAAIANRTEVYAQKEEKIAQIKADYHSDKDPRHQLARLSELTDEYLTYQFDSAFKYVRLQKELLSHSPGLSSPDTLAAANLKEVLVLTSAGLFNESTDLLGEIDTVGISRDIRLYKLWVSSKTYYDLSVYTSAINGVDTVYRRKTLNYGRELLSYLPENEWEHRFVRGHERLIDGDPAGAATAFEKALATEDIPLHSQAMSHAVLGDIYAQSGRGTESLMHYTRSALLDLKSATRENTSLLKLSLLMLSAGDLERSYLYAQAALEDATFYNAYHRKIAVGDVLPLVENQRYQLLGAREKTLRNGLILIGFLCVALIILSFIVFRQVQKLRRAHKTIAAHNLDLSSVNRKLKESDAIKDEYIGLSFYNYSANVKKLEQLSRFVNRKLQEKKYADIKAAFNPDELQKEREQMYESFDATFLRLFPSFIERYDALFAPEDRTQPQGSDRLTTEMRIFALIRLGITKSDEIAGFLDYSVHTINTYKTRVKNKSLIDNAHFEDAILAIESVNS